MKIYLVIESWGSYDDYFSHPIRAFYDKSDADKFVLEYNENLEVKLVGQERCLNCHFCWNYDKVKEYQRFIDKARANCPRANFTILNTEDEFNGDLECNCYNYKYDLDTYSVKIEDIELS